MNKFCTTIFCDDVRSEVNGKDSYIGIYNEKLILKPFTAQHIHSISFIFQLFTELGREIKNVEFCVEFNGQLVNSTPFDISPQNPKDVKNHRVKTIVILNFRNLYVGNAEALIKTYVIIDNERIESDSLEISPDYAHQALTEETAP